MQLTEPVADERHIVDDAGADGDRPEGELIPGQKIAREVCGDHQQKHGDADQPVEFARRTIRARGKDADKMKHRHDDQQVGAPMMQVADEFAEPDVGVDFENIEVGLRRGGRVIVLQDDASQAEHRHQQGGESAQAPTVCPVHGGGDDFGAGAGAGRGCPSK